jgi:uncharacterized protein YggE
MKKIALALSLAVISSTAYAADMIPVRTISVSGQAERKVVPDEAHITVNLNSQAMKLTDAKASHDVKITKLMGIVKDAGIDEKKVKTQSSNIQPIYDYQNDPKTGQGVRVFKGYRAQTSVDITIGDTSKLAGLMDKITAAGFEKGANQEWGDLLSSYYTLSNPDQIRDELLAQAITNARSKAENMAKAAGAKIGRVYQINEGSVPSYSPRPMPMLAMDKSAGAEAAPIAPPAGEQEVNSTVTVIYELE